MSLKALRVNAELSQTMAAEAVGVDKATIISWEKNRTFPNIMQLDKLCKLYGCGKDDIFLPDMLTKSK